MTKKKLDLSALKNAVTSLENALGVAADEAWLGRQSTAMRETIIAGVIQNFEFVYELSVKMMRRQIEMESDFPEEVDNANYRDLVRTAGEKGLVEDVEAWFGYRELRNESSHTYDHEKAQKVYGSTMKFITDAKKLLAVLEKRNG